MEASRFFVYGILSEERTRNLLAVVGIAKPTKNFSYQINVGEEHTKLAKKNLATQFLV